MAMSHSVIRLNDLLLACFLLLSQREVDKVICKEERLIQLLFLELRSLVIFVEVSDHQGKWVHYFRNSATAKALPSAVGT